MFSALWTNTKPEKNSICLKTKKKETYWNERQRTFRVNFILLKNKEWHEKERNASRHQVWGSWRRRRSPTAQKTGRMKQKLSYNKLFTLASLDGPDYLLISTVLLLRTYYIYNIINNSRRKDKGNQWHDGGCISDTKFCWFT